MLTIDGHLRSGSPCINHCPGGSTNDIDGDARPYPGGSNYDIGADEFIDTDADGLPDWLEMLAVGSATGADPGTDDDLDGLTILWEYDNGLNPGNADTDGDGRNHGSEISDGTNPLNPDNIAKTYYVDCTNGKDTYDGLADAWDGSHGPKATIQTGIGAAGFKGWGYKVLVSDGIYTGPMNRNIGFHGLDITLRSKNGPEVTIIDCEASGHL